jgi:hypothetical protein
MISHFVDVALQFPKWFLYGLCPLAYFMVGLLHSHLFNWKRAKNVRIGCGNFSGNIASPPWEVTARCPIEKLCSTHEKADIAYHTLAFFSVFAWPGTIGVFITIYAIKGIWKAYSWFWEIPERALKRKWAKLDRLIELLREKYPYAPIKLKEPKGRSDLMIFHVTYQEKVIVGGYVAEKGFRIHATLSTETLDVSYENFKELIPEVQGAYCKVLELLGKPS